jgi:Mrp family chromosome partitioning ATPase
MPFQVTSAGAPAYEGILYTVFQQLRQSVPQTDASGAGKGLVVAFTSVSAGEGVTHTIRALLHGLAHEGHSRSLLIASERLRRLTAAVPDLLRLCVRMSGGTDAALYELADSAERRGMGGESNSWTGSWEYRRDVLEHLRAHFDYVLIDTPALKKANDLLSVAPFADGVILVVEAGRTRKEQVLHAEKQIEFARGRLLGHILNKRTYVVPEWLYRRL